MLFRSVPRHNRMKQLTERFTIQESNPSYYSFQISQIYTDKKKSHPQYHCQRASGTVRMFSRRDQGRFQFLL